MAAPLPKPAFKAADHGEKKKFDPFGGRRVSARVAQAAAAVAAVRRQGKPSGLRESLIGISLGLTAAMVWKMYHLTWRGRVQDLQQGIDEGYLTTVVAPNTVPVKKGTHRSSSSLETLKTL